MTQSAGNLPKQERSKATRAEIIRGASEVFAKISFSDARIKDISVASGISPGSMYFHFGNKDDIAIAVLESQQERMKDALTEIEQSSGTALEKLIELIRSLGDLIAGDRCVQAGIRLAQQPQTGLEISSHQPYFDWVLTTEELIAAGVVDGSIREGLSVSGMAETLNELFIGAQTLAGFESQWVTLPERLERIIPLIELLLASPDNGPVPDTPNLKDEK